MVKWYRSVQNVISNGFWELEMFPEVHIFKKGKRIASFIDASDTTKSDFVAYLKKIEQSN
ncbi:hypothetical protein [Tenacibaculum agarivorans]|uniref:hypothetical protein n=1 Tax=Tenacibaculum agarivorans TaxID=1908389 RepID=UPI00094BBE10|nr:hypothetical protein [Tenacibaculum agarivorans]